MKTIAWDVDDVLNNLMQAWFEQHWRPSHPGCTLSYDRITQNPPHELLGVSLPEYLDSLDEFRLSGAAGELPPVPEVLDWFRRYGERFRHMALTATPLIAAHVSAAWVMRHYGAWLRSFHLIPSPRRGELIPAYDRSKDDFLRRHGGVDILVEDNPANVAAAQALGLQTVLIPRPWNQSQMSLGEALDLLTGLAETSQPVGGA